MVNNPVLYLKFLIELAIFYDDMFVREDCFYMKHFFNKDKINAFLIHLAISLVIFLVLLYFILVHWYPHPLFGTDGGWQGIRLIAAVDIILGPLLTFIVFNKSKPRLKLDLAIIALIQFSALISGTWIVYKEHPALIVFIEDNFRPVTASQLIEQGISVSSVKQYGDTHLPMAYVNLPGDFEALQKLRVESLNSGRLLSHYVELYESLESKNRQIIRVASINMESHLNNKPADNEKYENFLKQNKVDQGKLIYIPLYSRYKHVIAVLDSDTFDFVDVLEIKPPEYKPPKFPKIDNGQQSMPESVTGKVSS